MNFKSFPQACNKNDPNDYKWDSRDPQRTPFQWNGEANTGFCDSCKPWIPINDNYKELNLEQQREAPKSFFKFYQQLSTLRTSDDFKFGHFSSVSYNNDIFAFKRSFDGHSHVVVINLGSSDHEINLNELNTGERTFGEKLRVVVAGSRSSYNAGDEVDTNEFVVKSFDAVVLSGARNVFASFVLLVLSVLIKFFM